MAGPHTSKAASQYAVIRAELMRAVELHRTGRLDAAEALCKKVLRRQPNQPDALHFLGIIAMDRGRYGQAIELIAQALTATPNNANAHSNLGNALKAAGRGTEAAAHYRSAIALDPGFAHAHYNLGTLQNDIGDHTAALASFSRAVELDANLPEAYAGKGFALRNLGRHAEAETAFRRALALRPNMAGAWCELGSVLGELDRFDEAMVCHRKALELEPKVTAHHMALGQTLYRRGDVAAAVASLRRAVELDEAFAVGWNELGRMLRVLGRFDEALTCLQQALAINPDLADAHRNLALIGVHSAEQREIGRLVGLIDRSETAPMDRVIAGFTLGKLFDDAGEYDQAFTNYAAANRLFRDIRAAAGQRFDAAALRREVDGIIEHWNAETVGAVIDGRSESDVPVFIVGMPRSGTSLVEQIAASHSQVFGAGELRNVGGMANARAAEGWDAAARLARLHVDRLGERSGGALRVIDKLPDNIFHLGMIAALFPRARIIHCTRDALDTGLSCFFQMFTSGMLFSYSLADCGTRLVETDRLANHWRHVLRPPMLEMNYEKLVADLEGESRRLIDFLGLEWEAGCLAFHETDRPVTTASGWQVRQPLYDRSVGRWRHYAAHLGDLIAAIERQ